MDDQHINTNKYTNNFIDKYFKQMLSIFLNFFEYYTDDKYLIIQFSRSCIFLFFKIRKTIRLVVYSDVKSDDGGLHYPTTVLITIDFDLKIKAPKYKLK